MQDVTAPPRIAMPSEGEFTRLAGHLKRLSGINLPFNEKNMALIAGRLQKVRSRHGIDSYRTLIAGLDAGDKQLASIFVCAMTTNTTHFFREAQHFDLLTKLLQDRAARSRGEIRLWCAASSTGEEPYGLAMLLDDLRLKTGVEFRMLATDIDVRVLATAQAGIYAAKQVESIPAPFLQRYFRRVDQDEAPQYAVSDELKARVQFGRFNLLKNYPFKGQFDVIFCRNVLIYFDKPTVEYVVTQMTRVLARGGHLFLGHSEAIAGMVPGLARVGPAVYRRE